MSEFPAGDDPSGVKLVVRSKLVKDGGDRLHNQPVWTFHKGQKNS